MSRTVLMLACAALVTGNAEAQLTYPVHRMDFDIWCTEEQRLPPDRCDKRLPDDVQKFEAYRRIVERYEIPYLQEKDQALHFDRDVLHNDPIDRSPTDPIKPPPQPTDGR